MGKGQTAPAWRFEAPAPPKTPKSARTRERILDLAGRLFVERGYHGVSLRDVAAGADLTKSALYGHFRSKGQLLVEVIRWRLQERERQPGFLEAITSVEPGVDLMFEEAGREIRQLEIDAASAARHDPDVAAGLVELYRDRRQRIVDVATGEAGDPEATAWFVHALTAGIGVTEATGLPLPPPARLHEVLVRAVHSVAELDVPGGRP